MSDELTPIQIDARQTKCALCEEIGIRGCGGCPLDKIRREKNMSCDEVCRDYPMLVLETVRLHKNGTEQPKAGAHGETESIRTNWEATAKQLQEENKQLRIELDAERQCIAQMERDQREGKEAFAEKMSLFERVVGQRDAYREVLEWVLHDQKGGKNGI